MIGVQVAANVNAKLRCPLGCKAEMSSPCPALSPQGLWMAQIARNLLDAEDGFLLGKRHLLLDRDPLYTTDFRAALERAGRVVRRQSLGGLLRFYHRAAA